MPLIAIHVLLLKTNSGTIDACFYNIKIDVSTALDKVPKSMSIYETAMFPKSKGP